MKMITLTLLFLLLSIFPVRKIGAETGATPVLILRDPFQQPVPKENTVEANEEVANTETIIIDDAAKLKLKAIIINGEKSMININGKILAIGDEIEDYRLVEIQDNSAFLQKNSIKVEVSLDE